MTTIENILEQGSGGANALSQFTMVQHQLALDSFVDQHVNYRRLGNKRPKKTEQILNGYEVIMNLLSKFKVEGK